MNYNEWADEYDRNALRVKSVIERKKQFLNDNKLSADSRQQILDQIAVYRSIYAELIRAGDTLRTRAGVRAREA